MQSVATVSPNVTATSTSSSGDSENETPNVSRTSAVSTSTTFSDLGDVSVVSGRQQQAALKWSQKEKKKAKDKAKKKLSNKITKGDFSAKSMEFKLWLLEAKDVKFESLNSKKQKEYFKKFIKKWNNKKLDKKFYRGVECLWAVGTPTTPSAWAVPSGPAPGALTPGTGPDPEERYSRSHRPEGATRLGTFGKKAGAEMLRHLRAVENTTSQGLGDSIAIMDTSQRVCDKKNKSCQQTASAKSWIPSNILPGVLESSPILPAPPSPCELSDSQLHSTLQTDEGMSPLPPPPAPTGPFISPSLIPPPPCHAPPPPPTRHRPRSCILEDKPEPLIRPRTRSCVEGDNSLIRPRTRSSVAEHKLPSMRQATRSLRGRPLSYAGESDASFMPPPPPPKPKSTQPLSTAAINRRESILKRSYTKANPAPPAPDRSTNQDTIPTKRGTAPPAPDRSISLEALQNKPDGSPTTKTAPPPPERSVSLESLQNKNSASRQPAVGVPGGPPGSTKARPAPPPRDRSVSLENLPERRPHKMARRSDSADTVTPADDASMMQTKDPYAAQLSNASHAVFQTLTRTRGQKKAGEFTGVRTNSPGFMAE